MGSVAALFVKDRGKLANQVKEVFLCKKPLAENLREVSLITLEGYLQLKKSGRGGFCHNRFKADFVIQDIDIEKIGVNNLLFLGSALIKITESGKKCHKNCPLLSMLPSCNLHYQIFFGKVLREGLVRQGDPVCLVFYK